MAHARALITGITGMVGSHLADFLLAQTDWDLFGMCRWRSPLDNVSHLIDRANHGDRLKFLYGDLRDYISLQNVVEEARPDFVFHLAAQSFFDNVRSEEHTSELQSLRHLVCRLLLDKK